MAASCRKNMAKDLEQRDQRRLLLALAMRSWARGWPGAGLAGERAAALEDEAEKAGSEAQEGEAEARTQGTKRCRPQRRREAGVRALGAMARRHGRSGAWRKGAGLLARTGAGEEQRR